jgi:hypothetical protein
MRPKCRSVGITLTLKYGLKALEFSLSFSAIWYSGPFLSEFSKELVILDAGGFLNRFDC